MIQWRANLQAHLLADVAVAAIVDTRVFAGAVDPAVQTKPYVFHTQDAGTTVHHLAGGSGYTYATLTILCVADTLNEAHDLGEAVRQALDFRGSLNGVSAKVLVTDVSEDVLMPDDGSDPGPFIVTVMARVWAAQAVTPTA